MDGVRRLLVVEDDPGLQKQLKWSFEDVEVVVAGDRDQAMTAMRRFQPQVVTLDLGLPPDPGGSSEGFAVLEEIYRLAPLTRIIVLTGNQDRDNAVRAIALGAHDFCPKPFDTDTLNLIVQRAFHVYELDAASRQYMPRGAEEAFRGIVTESTVMRKVLRTVEKLAPTDVTTLLLGESGTGKELLARALHDLSPRAKKGFVAINCGAIPENLLESELFGYEKGAFTGAVKQTKGKVEFADGGTLFLDEVGDLPLALQVKLLRFLQERVIERVGGRQLIPVDCRVVCATHQNLETLMRQGQFREDLYYRIGEVSIQIPPLRERPGDALVLARTFVQRFNEHLGRSVKGFTEDALAALEQYGWPGNVRELESRVKRAVILAEDKRISRADLDLAGEEVEPIQLTLRQMREHMEKEAVMRALTVYNRNMSQTASALGVSRTTLYDLMNKYALK
jgi:two-component system, NtrC family, response regulator